MKQIELLEEARKRVTSSEVDAFVKGARWIMDSIHEGNVNIVLEDSLPLGSIVLERFPNGSPKIILGPNLGSLTRAEAIRVTNKGLWHLPSVEQLKTIWNDHKEIFKSLNNIGESYLMTRSYGQNGTWTNVLAFRCRDAAPCHLFINSPLNNVFTRAILDLSTGK